MIGYVTRTQRVFFFECRQVMVASPARFTNLWWFRLCVGIHAKVG